MQGFICEAGTPTRSDGLAGAAAIAPANAVPRWGRYSMRSAGQSRQSVPASAGACGTRACCKVWRARLSRCAIPARPETAASQQRDVDPCRPSDRNRQHYRKPGTGNQVDVLEHGHKVPTVASGSMTATAPAAGT
jgi:hypothetical protein